jgi:hypothetical protein
MGRSVQMHEGVVFMAIVGGVVYGGVLGALMVVPVLASVGVVGRYLRRRILGLEPFPPAAASADEGSQAASIAAPGEEIDEREAAS